MVPSLVMKSLLFATKSKSPNQNRLSIVQPTCIQSAKLQLSAGDRGQSYLIYQYTSHGHKDENKEILHNNYSNNNIYYIYETI